MDINKLMASIFIIAYGISQDEMKMQEFRLKGARYCILASKAMASIATKLEHDYENARKV